MFPDSPIELRNGNLVCHDHYLEYCGTCCVDYTPENESNANSNIEGSDSDRSDLKYSDDYDNETQALASPQFWTDQELRHDVAICSILENCQIVPLEGAAARFTPQIDHQIHGDAKIDMPEGSPKPFSFSRLSIKACGDCSHLWLDSQSQRHAPCPSHAAVHSGSRSIFVFVDGACPSNGKPAAKAGFGVFFHPDSSLNVAASLDLPAKEYPTNQKAEIYAVVFALETVRTKVLQARHDFLKNFIPCAPCHDRCWRESLLFRTIITTDSSYVVECMTSHMAKWIWIEEKQVYINRKSKKTILNSKAIRLVEEEVEKLAKLGIEVVYYHVGRGENSEADALARQGAKEAIAKLNCSMRQESASKVCSRR